MIRCGLSLVLLAALVFPAMAFTVQIPGPDGMLEAEAIAPVGASHVVVIIPGSGPIDRDGNSGHSRLLTNTYKLLAEDLAQRGIASLRIDKRGFYGSASAIEDPNDVTVAAYATDARAWVTKAADFAPCVWIAGHSEGGLVALLAAQQEPDGLCGLILMATSGRPTGRLLLEQFEANPANAPFMQEVESIIDSLENQKAVDIDEVSPVLRGIFAPGLQRYMMELFSHDPIALAGNWRGPTLIIQGDADLQVRPHDADLLEKALPFSRRMDLKGGTHMLKADVAGQPFATYADPSLPLHEAVIDSIVDFISDETILRPGASRHGD